MDPTMEPRTYRKYRIRWREGRVGCKNTRAEYKNKTRGRGMFSCAPAPESLLHQTFAPTEVLPLRPITLQVPPERTVLLSLSLQCKFYVGFSEFGVGVWHAGVG